MIAQSETLNSKWRWHVFRRNSARIFFTRNILRMHIHKWMKGISWDNSVMISLNTLSNLLHCLRLSLSTSPPFIICDSHSFILNPDTWMLLTLITHLCYFCSCTFKIQLFSFSVFFLRVVFFRECILRAGPLLMEFPVILFGSPFTWIGSTGLVSAPCQVPD